MQSGGDGFAPMRQADFADDFDSDRGEPRLGDSPRFGENRFLCRIDRRLQQNGVAHLIRSDAQTRARYRCFFDNGASDGERNDFDCRRHLAFLDAAARRGGGDGDRRID